MLSTLLDFSLGQTFGLHIIHTNDKTVICRAYTRRCNGVPDCPGGVDETDCDENRCRKGYFRCSQQIWCVPEAQVCDGKRDCDDGSDETGHACRTSRRRDGPCCLSRLSLVAENATRFETGPAQPAAVGGGPCQGFVCASGRCVDWHDVCDGAEHCELGEDEGGQCGESQPSPVPARIAAVKTGIRIQSWFRIGIESGAESESAAHGGSGRCTPCAMPACEHECRQTPTGPVCVCARGYRSEAHGRAPCRDVDECAEGEPCAHVCHNTPGSFMCSCHSGHALRADRRSCKVTSGRMSFVFARGSAVHALSADGSGASILFSDDKSASFTGLSYNVREKTLYVTSELNGTLYEVSTSRANVVITNVGRPAKVAVDWVSGNVYFVDNTPGERHMRVCHPRRRRCAKLQRLPGDVEVRTSSNTNTTLQSAISSALKKYQICIVECFRISYGKDVKKALIGSNPGLF
ncbi:Putative vitellogenin receptor [Eumeta japonica]|uniref:Vitellogenin receptor n=1 Tax=Eumeta variegata TaxID=151549 RepID=A0A4C1WUJ3_EUMVA|nr:Putative vitellogenin receptor [Eumeta japonica]